MLHTDDFDVLIEETVTLYTFTELQAYYALHTTTRKCRENTYQRKFKLMSLYEK